MTTRFTLAATLAVTACLSLGAQTFVDSFSYSDGALVGQGTWVQIGSSTVNPVTVTGGAISLANNGQDIGVDTGSAFTSGSIYAGFDLTLSAAQATGDYFFAFNTAASASNYSGRFFAKSSGSGYVLGLQMGVSGATPTYSTTELSFGTEYRIVVRYDIIGGATNPGGDTGLFYVDPSSLVEGDNTSSVALVSWAGTTQDNGSFQAIAFRQGTASNAPTISKIDNLVVSSSFANAAVPEPATYAAIFGGLALVGTVIRRRAARRA